MSIQDEYKDLESRLRQSKPQTEPLPPAFKRQVRHELMEQMTMNDNRFSFRKLSMALGGLILLIGIPVFFWLAQMSIGSANFPGTEPDPSQLDPSRPTPTRVMGIVSEGVEGSEQNLDRFWLISTDISQGETIGRYGTINVTVGYKLVTVQEAELIVKLVEGPQELLSANKMVSGAIGTAVVSLPLADLEEPEGNLVTLELNLMVENPDHSTTKRVYQDFGAGWTVDLTAEPAMTTAEIVRISKPSLVEIDGVVDEFVYDIELTIAYTLSGYDQALLVAGYEYSDANGSAGGYEVIVVSAGSGDNVPIRLRVDRSFFNERGETIEGVNFFVRLNHYDETAAEWVNLYPGDADLTDGERSIPYPYHLQDVFYVESAAWVEDAAGQPILNVRMSYNLTSQPTAEIEVKVIWVEDLVLASDSLGVEAGNGSLTIPLAIDPTLDPLFLADIPLVMVSAVMTVGEVVIEDGQSVVYQGASETAENEIQIIGYEVVTRTTESGVAADITLFVGYNLSSDYSSGRITFSSQYSASTTQGGGSGGGGGGSEKAVTPGNGTVEFEFGFETTSWVTLRDWLDSMSTSLLLFGDTTSGEEVLVAEVTQIGTD